ncbi:MAG: diguanylate cyclase [Sulfuricurvum sp.]|uniref:sensor domain-containing protein n=1 Tax=Sulfuricurvum sp. TaxID=2025608 RepID=UPI00273520F5|nr:diguanylate cyclase [Sulfuricurvum sp.]MDP3291614.1 diguanylate cyclase [Sulfuricurvum sp.]
MIELVAIPSLVLVLALWVVHSIFLNRRLIESQKRYLQFFSDSPVALIVIDRDYRIIEWNQSAEAIFGWNYTEAVGENIIDFIVPNFDKDHVVSVLQKTSLEGVSYSKNYNITQQNNEIFCEWRNRLLEGGKGEILCMAQDITLSKKTLDELNKRSAALESAGDAIFYTDNKGIIEFANPSFFALSLNDQHTLYGTHIGKYLFKERLTFNTIFSQFSTNHTWRGTLTKNSASGEKVFSTTITAIYHHNRLVSYVANLHDITHITSHVDALTYRVQHDPLTGATNRTTLNDRLEHAITRSKRRKDKIALYFIDLNDFKLVNDRYGHEAGDRLLQDVAKNIRACLRNSDTVCRYGGDEFIVMIEEVKGEDHLQSIRDAIAAAISEPIYLDEKTTLFAKASIGLACYPDDATDTDSLIKAADMAMYAVKKEKNSSERAPMLCVDSYTR